MHKRGEGEKAFLIMVSSISWILREGTIPRRTSNRRTWEKREKEVFFKFLPGKLCKKFARGSFFLPSSRFRISLLDMATWLPLSLPLHLSAPLIYLLFLPPFLLSPKEKKSPLPPPPKKSLLLLPSCYLIPSLRSRGKRQWAKKEEKTFFGWLDGCGRCCR